MSVIATPSRTPFADRQILCGAPLTLAHDLRSPTPNKKKQQQPQAQSKPGSVVSQAVPGHRAAVPKRGRDDDHDGLTSAYKKSRLSQGTATSTTSTLVAGSTHGNNKFTTPPPPDINGTMTTQEKDKVKETQRAQKHSKEERAEREKEIQAFRDKYTRVFPNFSFYFHGLDSATKKALSLDVQALGARVEDFFSSSVTHVISNRPRPPPEEAERIINNKENEPLPPATLLPPPSSAKPVSRGHPVIGALRSPIKLRSAAKGQHNESETIVYDSLVVKAVHLKMKMWDSNKLENILVRLLSPAVRSHVTRSHMLPPRTNPSHIADIKGSPKAKSNKSKSKGLAPLMAITNNNKSIKPTLSHLLLAEKNSGITTERDPNTKRPDYDYFPRNTFFLLIQDCEDHYAPVAVKDYGRWKKGEKPGWPVLNLDAIGYTEKEIDKGRVSVFGWKPGMDCLDPTGDVKRPSQPAVAPQRKAPDLRRAVSMQNLNRTGKVSPHLTKQGVTPPAANRTPLTRNLLKPHPTFVHPAGASRASITSGASASGPYAASQGGNGNAYIAASGNSAIISSNIASTTSAAPTSKLLGGNGLPGAIGKRLHQEVLTKRTFGKATAGPSTSTADVAQAKPQFLKKSKSTNTLRLPPREETKKPGYCENCRYKFDDFHKHIRSTRHLRFANNPDNFMELDDTLNRVRRRTLEEWQKENAIPMSESDDDSCWETDDEECTPPGSDGEGTERDEYTIGGILNVSPGSSTSSDDIPLAVATTRTTLITQQRKFKINTSFDSLSSSSLSSLSDDGEEDEGSTLKWDEDDDDDMDDLALKAGDSEGTLVKTFKYGGAPSQDDMDEEFFGDP
ncbi:hypothetical protein FRB94_001900 [Tulasnella sp. JGI-2019a]|nr:hypothetical protein FRB93_004044 [Tulasnella sp. JGI-2019a]KAG9005010.1 hypothetical protein FRB94_001900 [Tulasnella sp. JGI-2019a]KAG9031941.1 hypothetical protein FRB95_002077 [Tulasnella sp. JGI-2019a]